MSSKWLLSACMITGLVLLTACEEEPPAVEPINTTGMDGTGTGFDNNGVGFNNTNDANGPSNLTNNALDGLDNGWKVITDWKFPTIHFAYDSDNLGESEIRKLQQVASYLKTNGNVGVIVEGNCDERGTEEYNRALGERRALSVKTYLTQMGISADRVRTISYGEDKPVMQGTGESVWSQNRRADLVPAQIMINVQ